MPVHALSARREDNRRQIGLLDLIALWRQRRALAALDPSRLDDLGLTSRAAEAEAARPFWDVPDHWRG